MTEHEIDHVVWSAHRRRDLRIETRIDVNDLRRWANQLRLEASGYWHGSTGRLCDRLGIDDAAWSAVPLIHRDGPPVCLGDSSLDLVPYILARRGMMFDRTPDGLKWWPMSRDVCGKYFDLGIEVGNHRAPSSSTWPPAEAGG